MLPGTRLRQQAASAIYGRVTISLGVADTIPKKGNDPLNLIEAADKALYEAKKSGRNRVNRANEGAKKQ